VIVWLHIYTLDEMGDYLPLILTGTW
jgi:hypothetical protein